MKIYEWKQGMTAEESKNGAYWERNMLALLMACEEPRQSGWYYDTDNNWDGWKRVISLKSGHITFHIPDDFDVGSLEQIEPNWDGRTTNDKWKGIMRFCRCQPEVSNEI